MRYSCFQQAPHRVHVARVHVQGTSGPTAHFECKKSGRVAALIIFEAMLPGELWKQSSAISDQRALLSIFAIAQQIKRLASIDSVHAFDRWLRMRLGVCQLQEVDMAPSARKGRSWPFKDAEELRPAQNMFSAATNLPFAQGRAIRFQITRQ